MNFNRIQPLKLAVVGALCASPLAAHACSCLAPPAPKVALQQSAAVFVGKITSVEQGKFGNTFQFAVSKQWKGISGKTTSIVSATNSAACGIVFDKDRDYLIYANKTEGDEQLSTNLCTRTKRLTDAAADLAELGAPKTVTQIAMPVKKASYPVADNGVVQINAGTAADPLTAFASALQTNRTAQRMRLMWAAPNDMPMSGTALYNRADSTLKVYSRARNGQKISIQSLLYRGVTDDVLQSLAASEGIGQFFSTFADYGVSREDLGSRTVIYAR